MNFGGLAVRSSNWTVESTHELIRIGKGWVRLEPGLSALVGVRHPKQSRLIERLAQELQAHRQVVRESAGNRNAWNTRHVCRNGEDIGEIHLVRIVHALTNTKGRGWGGGRNDGLRPR